MERTALADKIMILGVDGLDPRLTKKFVEEGKMPNTKKFIERGAQRDDLILLGGHPTVTPPMWTTLATGCYANVHGITSFYRQASDELDAMEYNIDSRLCKAEQLWNVLAESGKKTLVWNWPGSAWPPSSDSPNLWVVDGTAPGNVGVAKCRVEEEYILGANESVTELRYIHKGAFDASAPCMVDEIPDGEFFDLDAHTNPRQKVYIMKPSEGQGAGGGMEIPLDVVKSPIKPATGWVNTPKDAKEFTLLLGGGYIHRPCLIKKNEAGIYDTVAVYKNKKSIEPIAVLPKGKMVTGIIDEGMKNSQRYMCNRSLKVMEMAEDGSDVKMYISTAVDINNDIVWHPQWLHKAVCENLGYPPPTSYLTAQDVNLNAAMLDCWDDICSWQAKSIKYLVDNEGVEVVFSHLHNVDDQEHCFIRYMTDKGHNKISEETARQWVENLYLQTDRYLGEFLPYLDQGWTIFIVSDHAQVCPTYDPVMIGDMCGLNVCLMEELGYTVLKKDKNGNKLREIDWEKTKAVAMQSNNIYINLKGRTANGIVDPADKYELEEQIMTDLYGYKHPISGKRVISIALRNRDAVLLGYGGPECGDICFWVAEGYNYDHADSLSTTLGECDTSVSPIFIAAGKGLKKGYKTERIIREVDLAPTVAFLAGVRMPKQCEGAPVYQILEKEF